VLLQVEVKLVGLALSEVLRSVYYVVIILFPS